jgi:hypothetical protein
MVEVKSWIESRTIWSAVVALAPILTQLLGFDVDATLRDILTIVGLSGTIYFRIQARKRIQLSNVSSVNE